MILKAIFLMMGLAYAEDKNFEYKDYLHGECVETVVDGIYHCSTRKHVCFFELDYMNPISEEKYIKFSCKKSS